MLTRSTSILRGKVLKRYNKQLKNPTLNEGCISVFVSQTHLLIDYETIIVHLLLLPTYGSATNSFFSASDSTQICANRFYG